MEDEISVPYVMTKEGSPYILDHDIRFVSSSGLKVNSGVDILLENNPYVYIGSKIELNGDVNNVIKISGNGQIALNSLDGYISNTKFFNGVSLYINDNSKLVGDGVEFSDSNKAISVSYDSSINLINSNFHDLNNGIIFLSKPVLMRNTIFDFFVKTANAQSLNNIIQNSIFENINSYAVDNRRNEDVSTVNVSNNWWGDPSGPNYYFENYSSVSVDNPEIITNNGLGQLINGNLFFKPWLIERPIIVLAEEEKCCSNVVFIPGIQASRLYGDDISGKTEKLWEPSSNSDVRSLYLNEKGESISNNIEAKDLLASAYGFVGIYDSFIKFMDILVSSSTKKVKEWTPLPYDWRMSVEDIAKGMIQDIEKTASTSLTGKVSIVAHSNGGLVAKSLVNELKNLGKENLIDKLIFVAVPHLGAPKTIFSMLHGDWQEIPPNMGLVVDKPTVRGLAENMKSAFGLLPTSKYFENINNKILSFTASAGNLGWDSSLWQSGISSFGTLKNFLSGILRSTTTKPALRDISSPNILSVNLLNNTEEFHNKLDNLEIPTNIEIFNIVGSGIFTPIELSYKVKEHRSCTVHGCNILYPIQRGFGESMNGDGTVPALSAKSSADFVDKNLYINLKGYSSGMTKDRSHADILEADVTRELVGELVSTTSNISNNLLRFKLPKYVTLEEPEFDESSYRSLEFTIHSPVDMIITDDKGRQLKIVKGATEDDLDRIVNEIPGAEYIDFGDQTFSVPPEGKYTVIFNATGQGFFGFDAVITDGTHKVISEAIFSDIPVSPELEAKYEYIPVFSSSVSSPVSTISSSSLMSVDIDGDGKEDIKLGANKKLTPEEELTFLRGQFKGLGLDIKVWRRIDKKFDKILSLIKKQKKEKVEKIIEKIYMSLYKFSEKYGEKSGKDGRGKHHQKMTDIEKNAVADSLEKTIDNLE
ncbi:MAG: hypothetical protein Q7R78_01615 [bacterium]|nr:hypothetical protein [bacterium]